MAEYKIKWRGKEVFTQATDANEQAMEKACLLVESYVKTHFTKQGSYRQYLKGSNVKGIRTASTTGKMDKRFKQTKQYHWSAQPNDPPDIDTGVLRASILHKVIKTAFGIIGKVGVEAAVKYALHLEVGTKNMAKRPFLRPAIIANKRKIGLIFQKANS